MYNGISISNPVVLADDGIMLDGSGSPPTIVSFISDKYKINSNNLNYLIFDGFHSSNDSRLLNTFKASGYMENGVIRSQIGHPVCNISKKTPGSIGTILLPTNLKAFFSIVVGGGGGGGGGMANYNTNTNTQDDRNAGSAAGAGGCVGYYIQLPANNTNQYKLTGYVGSGGTAGIKSTTSGANNATNGGDGGKSYLLLLDNNNTQVFGINANGGGGGKRGNFNTTPSTGQGGTYDVSASFTIATFSTATIFNSTDTGGNGGGINDHAGGEGGVSTFSKANTTNNLSFKLFNNLNNPTTGPTQTSEGPALSIGAGGGGGHGENTRAGGQNVVVPGTDGKPGNPGAIYVFYLY